MSVDLQHLACALAQRKAAQGLTWYLARCSRLRSPPRQTQPASEVREGLD